MNDVKTYKNFVRGEWCSGSTGELFESINPSNGSLVARAQQSGPEDAHQAATVAGESFYSQDWAFNPNVRSCALFSWAANLSQHREELSQLLALEVGKTIREARYEVGRAISYLEFYAGVARSLYGSSTALSRDSYSILAREPVGVVAVIVPWNYPVTLMMRALAPALAAGNAVVVKPASYTPAITAACFEQLSSVDTFPPGIVNLVTGPGKTVGMQLVRDPLIDMIGFTGDSDTGKQIMREAAANMKKLALELGGKSANIVFEDANLAKAVPFAVNGIFSNAGQLCTVGSRLLVSNKIHDDFVTELKERTETIKVGPSMNEDSDMGPVASESQLQRVMRYIKIGKETAHLLTGGQRLTGEGFERGYYVAPTVFDHTPAMSPIVQDEIFGPVLAIQPFDDEEQAVDLANRTVFGLAAGVWTENINRAMRVARRLRAGTVWINTYNKLAPEVETGGYKESGIGRASGMEGIFEYTEIKHINIEMSSI